MFVVLPVYIPWYIKFFIPSLFKKKIQNKSRNLLSSSSLMVLTSFLHLTLDRYCANLKKHLEFTTTYLVDFFILVQNCGLEFFEFKEWNIENWLL